MDDDRRKAGASAGAGYEAPLASPLPPLRVSGLVVSRADLVAALRAFIPGLADIRPLEGTEDFLLVLPRAPDEGGEGPGA